MEGRVSDVQDVKSDLDCDAVAVLDRTENEIVAIYHGRGSQIDLAEQVLLAAEYYNDAYVAPEIPNSMVILNKLKEVGYNNIYSRQLHDERLEATDSEDLGWRTTQITRSYMVNQFITAMRDNSIKVTFQAVIDEMKTFIRDKTGKQIHMPSKHDDLLFAVMIALQVHLRCPSLIAYPDSHTASYSEHTANESFSTSGYVDMCDEEYEEDELQVHTA